MQNELVFESRHHHTVVRAASLHACLGVVTDLRLWVIMHTAAGNAEPGIDVFHDGPPQTACWSLEYAAQVAALEHVPELAAALLPSAPGHSA
jgi:hypothetical protein